MPRRRSRVRASSSAPRRRGQVVKAGVCKTPIGGSNPPVASTILLLSLAANLSAGLKGAYALLLHLPYSVELEVGRLGAVAFSSGYYVYLCSALGGLEARLCHHLRPAPKPRWHIDYLRRFAHPVEAWLCPTSSNLECLLYQTALGLEGAHRVEGVRTLRATPAMAAGIERRPWTLREIVDLSN